MSKLADNFLFMLDNGYMETLDTLTQQPIVITKQIKEEVNSNFDIDRLRKVSDNLDLFQSKFVIPFPRHNDALYPISKIIEEDSKEGNLYTIPFYEYKKRTGALSSENYNHLLFLDIERDGVQLTIPIYKLFLYRNHPGGITLSFTPISSNRLYRIKEEPNDRFLITKGDSIRTVFRSMKRQNKFRANISLDQAGIDSDFDLDKI